MLLSKDTIAKIQRLKLTPEDLFLFTDQLIKKYLTLNGNSEISFDRITAAADKLFEEMAMKVSLVDSTLKQSVESEKAKFFNSIKTIQSKVLKAQKVKEEQNISQINKLRDKLFPAGSIQEREENILQYLAMYGFSFVDELKNTLCELPREFLLVEI